MADRTTSRRTHSQAHAHAQHQRHGSSSSSRRKVPSQATSSQPYRLPLPPITSQAHTQPRSAPVLETSYHSFPVSLPALGSDLGQGPGAGLSSFMAMPQTLPLPHHPVSVPTAYQTTTTTTTEIDVLMQGDYPLPVSESDGGSLYLMDTHSLSNSQSPLGSASASNKLSPSGCGSVISSTTGTLSFLTAGSESVVTEDGSGSGLGGYVMVSHRRTYSEKSDRTSDGGEGGALYSTPDEGEWVSGVEGAWGQRVPQRREFAVEVEVDAGGEVMDEDAREMPHDPNLVLYSLGTNEPRTVENPYEFQQVQSSGYQNTTLYQDPNPYNYQTVNHHFYVQTTGPAKVSSDGPWSPVAPQVPVYDSGYVAFLPSPGPAGEQDSDVSRSRASSATHSPQPGKSPASKPRSKKAGGKGKEKDASHVWEHTVVSKGGLQFVSENVKEEVDMRSGIRKGKLDPETAEKARRIRRMKACWNCWIQKVPCSEEKTCERCTKLFSPIADQLCCRSGFKDYESTFFPEYLHAHFKKRKIEDLISEHTTGFSNTVLVVDVSTGGMFKPMTLSANVFKPKTRELLRHASLVSQPGQDSQLVERYSAPVGILGLSPSEMKKLCVEHIDEMIANPAYAAQATAGDDTQLRCEILEIVRKYCSKDLPLVQNALKLHAIHYFMSTLITFSEESAGKVSRSIRNYDALLEPYLSSRLLNRQIKYVMHKLHREITIEVLEGLERSLRARTKDSWGPSFCTILILCLCIEDLQIAADTMVVCDMLKKGTESQYTRDQSYQVCLALDEYPFQQCKRLFHDIYKSHKEANGGAREGGFNPLRSIHEKTSTLLDSTTDAMVKSVYDVMHNSYDELLELSKRVATIEFGYTVKPKDIKTNNTGRLASDFLRSFFPES